MDMIDLENGISKRLIQFKLSRISLVRKWRYLPTTVKIGSIFILFVFLSMIYSFISSWSTLSYLSKEDALLALKREYDLKTSSISFSSLSSPTPLYKQKPFLRVTFFKPSNTSRIFSHEEISWYPYLINSRSKFNLQQKAIIEATLHSWKGYKQYAWGDDHLLPISKSSDNWFGVGLTIIDSLDTLLLMGLENEFNEAFRWIETDLQFHINKDVNCFEMTIRVLGGLLSAFHLTKSLTLLTKALDIGDRLIHCFDSPSKVPYSDVNLKIKDPKSPIWSPDSSTSEVSTMQLEFRDLSRVTKESMYENISFKTSQHLHNLTYNDPLVPIYINPTTGVFSSSVITLGARGDSYYEYLLKQYLQTSIDWLLEDYIKSIDAIQDKLVKVTNGPLRLTYIAELSRQNSQVTIDKMDHLVCFLPGTLALGYYHLIKQEQFLNNYSLKTKLDQHLTLAESLARTCYFMYNLTSTGLSPEIAYFNQDLSQSEEITIHNGDAHNLLRPEYVESLYYLYHITRKPMYRNQGWKIFQAFNKYSRVATGGFTSINEVRDATNVHPKDKQESFWIAETLKYLFLLFSDDLELIDKLMNTYIFNTEGHLVYKNLPVWPLTGV